MNSAIWRELSLFPQFSNEFAWAGKAIQQSKNKIRCAGILSFLMAFMALIVKYKILNKVLVTKYKNITQMINVCLGRPLKNRNLPSIILLDGHLFSLAETIHAAILCHQTRRGIGIGIPLYIDSHHYGLNYHAY